MKSTERLDLARCLGDLEFQDFLAETDILVRDLDVKIPEDPLKFTPDTLAGRFRLKLAQSPGYIVSKEALAKEMYGDTAPGSLNYASVWGSYLKRETQDSLPITHIARIGWGYGVESIKLTADTIPPIYRLWLDQGFNVPSEELAYALYGNADEGLIKNIDGLMSKGPLKKLGGTKATVLRTRIAAGQYTYCFDRVKTLNVDDFSEVFMSQDFQDWMAQPSVNLLQRKDPVATPYIYKPQNSVMYQLIALLEAYHGYILPTTFVSQKLFQTPDQTKRVMNLYQTAKKSLSDRQYLYSAVDLGIGEGIERLKLARRELSLLYSLWRNQGDFVSKADLSRRISLNQLKQNITLLKSKIRESDSEYRIEIDRSNGYKLEPTKKAPCGASLENLENLSVN